MRCIEPLEDRRLMSVSAISAFQLAVEKNPAFLAITEQATESRAKLDADRALAAQVRADHRTALKLIAAEGKVMLANDRAAIKAATDATTREQAVQTLIADKAKLKADLAAERMAAKQDAATWRATIQEDVRALKEDLKGFGAVRKAVVTEIQTGARRFVTSARAAGADGDVSDAEIKQLAADITAALDGSVTPDQALVETLLADLKGAFSDEDISAEELSQLVTDVRAVATSANVTEEEAQAVFNDIVGIVEDLDLSADELVKLAQDFANLYTSGV
jgi:hypothetical protein